MNTTLFFVAAIVAFALGAWGGRMSTADTCQAQHAKPVIFAIR